MLASEPAKLRELPWYVLVVACALLAGLVVQASIAARRDSVTIDEFVHLPVGLQALYSGDLATDPINPPWARIIAALPLLLNPPAFAPAPETSHWGLGYELMQRNPENYHAIFIRARSAMILLASLLGILVFAWASELYGWAAGLAALWMFCFSPNVLAHGHLVTLDISGALGFVATAYATWRLLERPVFPRAVVVGAALGAATLLKLSGMILAAVVVALVVLAAVRESRSSRVSVLRWFGLLAAVAATSLFVLNLGYAFDGSLSPLTTVTLDSNGTLAAIAQRWPWLRLPLPRPFINGVDMVLNVGHDKEPSFFLAGELSSEGWWYYHIAAFALKTPLPTVVVSLFATLTWLRGRSQGRRDYCVFVPVLAVFGANSLFNSLQIGVRHILPVYPLLFIGSGVYLARALSARGSAVTWRSMWRASRSRRVAPVVAGGALVWLASASVAVAPRYLQYFNLWAGGPDNGHHMLIDSNIDWGQDLIRLREYMDREGLEGIYLAYFGRVHPALYKIRFAPLERGRSHGKAAVSATFLMGRPYFWYRGGRMRWVPANTYTWLQDLKPVARVGAMFIYDIP